MESYNDMKRIEIIYIATGLYINYMKDFLASLKYFAPGYGKHLRVITNNEVSDDEFDFSNVDSYEIIHTFDLFYPCINLHKTLFINQMKHDDFDYIFYFDADTEIKEAPDYNWDRLFTEMDSGKILISKHPYYIVDGENYWEGTDYKIVPSIHLNYLFSVITGRDDRFMDYIPYDTYTYTISSFFAGKTDSILSICDIINSMVRHDMMKERGYHIPLLYDENYFNSLVNGFENGKDVEATFWVGQFIEMFNATSKPCDEVFLKQKNKGSVNKSMKQ